MPRVRRDMTVVIDERNAPEPDILVVRAEVVTGRRQTRYQAADVLLAVEVVSPTLRRGIRRASRRGTRQQASRTSGW